MEEATMEERIQASNPVPKQLWITLGLWTASCVFILWLEVVSLVFQAPATVAFSLGSIEPTKGG